MNLHGGHIGDGYPLCTDLGSSAFLRAGAKYRFLGLEMNVPELSQGIDWVKVPAADGSNAPPFAPEASTSGLYNALCKPDALATCRFQSTVILDEQIPCKGSECNLDTVRLVKIVNGAQAYYFEYLPLPCVSLGFLEAGVGRYAFGR